MIRALGKTITLEAGQSLTKHDFYLPLSDVLLDLVEQDLYGPSAKSASLLGCSLAHDFIRLSTVAGQLLWFVETTPVRIGTPDLLSITMLAESYLMSLRSACDVIAVIIHTFCIEDKKKGQVPCKFLKVFQVTKTNLKELVVDSGFQTYEGVYKDIPNPPAK